MSNGLDSYLGRGFWPSGYWPQDYWPHQARSIVAWIADAINGARDPDETITLNVIQPTILDAFENHFDNGNVFVIGESDNMEAVTTEPNRIIEALIKVFGIVTKANLPAQTLLNRINETIRRILLAGNEKGRACGGLALNIDCKKSDFHSLPGMAVSELDVRVKYFWD